MVELTAALDESGEALAASQSRMDAIAAHMEELQAGGACVVRTCPFHMRTPGHT